MNPSMTTAANSLPARNWSIVALSSVGMATVAVSYMLAIVVALGCLALPVLLFVIIPVLGASFIFARLLLGAFGLVAGLTILWSLIPRRRKVEVKGARIDLSRQPRLHAQIAEIAAALREPMPSEVYLVADANAFVMESSGPFGLNKRRILGLGLPLLQMLTVAQFRAVLAHEFAHYYAGDTRLTPWLYNTQSTMERVYENLGRKSQVLRFLTRWAVVAAPYMGLMGAMRLYWKAFMRITRAISRRQEFRSDELACHIAGSQALIEGLEGIGKCHAALNSYWSSVVVPAAMSGFQPEIAGGFSLFMQAPHIVKATSDVLAKQSSVTKSSPFDTHPPQSKRIQMAQLYNLPKPASSQLAGVSDMPMISTIDQLGPIEADLLKTVLPNLKTTSLKPLNWETAGTDVYVPLWRKQVAGFLPALATKSMAGLPSLVLDPGSITSLIPIAGANRLHPAQITAKAMDVLFCAFALCLLDNGWRLISQPGAQYLENGENKIEPGTVLSELKSGKLTGAEWSAFREQRQIGDWSLASSSQAEPQQASPVASTIN